VCQSPQRRRSRPRNPWLLDIAEYTDPYYNPRIPYTERELTLFDLLTHTGGLQNGRLRFALMRGTPNEYMTYGTIRAPRRLRVLYVARD
jgi:hypothetical protein